MTTHYILANQNGQNSGTGDTVYLAQNVVLQSGIDMRYESDGTTFGGGGDQIVFIDGIVFGSIEDYVGNNSGDDTINVGTTGSVNYSYFGAINLSGGANTINNDGTISASTYAEAIVITNTVGVHQSETDTINNTGVISGTVQSGNAGPFVITCSSVFALDFSNSGTVRAGAGAGALSVASTGGGSTFLNTGLIKGAITYSGGSVAMTNDGKIYGAVTLGDGGNTVINRGTIGGDVTLGNGVNRFDGRGGTVDGTVHGGSSSDTYTIDDPSLNIVEALGGGMDTVITSVNYRLTAGSEIENLMAAPGAGALVLIGNDLGTHITGGAENDKLVGGAGADILDGDLGSDTMIGRLGNDTYYVDDAADRVIEATNGGTDTLYTTVDYTLAAGVSVEYLRANTTEGLTLQGNAFGTRIYGNNGNDTLIGDAGNDVLNGGRGADVMKAGAGNDTYYVDNVGDTVTEAANAGSDTVLSSISYVLPANVEMLTLVGTAAINATGNTLANTIVGNTGANTINGGGGIDILTGGSGNDAFVFSSALNASTNVATITDFTVAADKIDLSHAIFTGLGSSGALASAAFTTGAAATNASQHVIYNSSTGALFYDADGNGATAQIQFAQLKPSLSLKNTDFMII